MKEYKSEIEALVKRGESMLQHLKWLSIFESELRGKFDPPSSPNIDIELHKKKATAVKNALNESESLDKYEGWYTISRKVVEQIIPERVDTFCDQYARAKNTKLTANDFRINDYLLGRIIANSNKFDCDNRAQTIFLVTKLLKTQIAILAAALEIIDSAAAKLSEFVHATIFDNELDAAKELLKAGHVRAGGAIAGVILEAHLKKICLNRNLSFVNGKATLSTYQQLLQPFISTANWRKISWCADIRNECCHKGITDPKKEDVSDLIEQVAKLIKVVS